VYGRVLASGLPYRRPPCPLPARPLGAVKSRGRRCCGFACAETQNLLWGVWLRQYPACAFGT
jgi:hypothetical protein